MRWQNAHELWLGKDLKGVSHPIWRHSETGLRRFRKTTKTSIRISGNPANIRSGYLLNTSLEHYRYTTSFAPKPSKDDSNAHGRYSVIWVSNFSPCWAPSWFSHLDLNHVKVSVTVCDLEAHFIWQLQHIRSMGVVYGSKIQNGIYFIPPLFLLHKCISLIYFSWLIDINVLWRFISFVCCVCVWSLCY